MGDLQLKDRIRITVGPRTGRTYTRDPTKCSKINGINTQCQNPPAPGVKSCQHHLDQARNRHRRLKNQREGARQAPELPKEKPAKTSTHEEQTHLYGKHHTISPEVTRQAPELPKKKRAETSTHEEQAHLCGKHHRIWPEGTRQAPELPVKKPADTSTHEEQTHLYGKHHIISREGTRQAPELPKKKPAKTSTHEEQTHLYGKHHTISREGTRQAPELPKKNRAKTSTHEEQTHLYGKQLMDEHREIYYEDVCSEERKKHLPHNPLHTSKNGSIIVRKIYKSKEICDSIYQLNLDLEQRQPLKSWIEHNKMQSFDEQRMTVKKWMNITKTSTNQVKLRFGATTTSSELD